MPSTVGPEAPPEQPLAMRWSIGRVLTVIVAIAMVLFWIWILSGGPAHPNPDRLDDRAFAARTEQRCTNLLDELKKLPGAGDFKSADQRADVLDQANAMVTTMVDEIEADAPKTGADAVRVKAWLSDWRIYIQDREEYASALRTNPDAKLVISVNPKLKDGVDQTIGVFAHDANDIDDCATPGDVG